jgi:phosphate transport system permease protein
MEAGTHVTGATPGARPLGVAKRRWGEEAIRGLLFLAAAISILTTFGIVFALVEESIPFFREVGRFFTTDWTFISPIPVRHWPSSTDLLITGTIVVAVPLGRHRDLPVGTRPRFAGS